MAAPSDLGDPADPAGMLALSERFFAALLVDGYSPRTIGAWRYKLRPFLAWSHERGVDRPQVVTRDLLERFKAWQHAWRDEDGKGLAMLSQVGRLIVIRAFFKWLAKNNLLLFNPASEVDYPKVGFRLPKVVFTPAEVEKVLAEPDPEARAARPRHPGDVLLHGPAQDGGRQPRPHRPRRGPGHAAGAPGEGSQGPGGAHR